jgi:hypothetical protein
MPDPSKYDLDYRPTSYWGTPRARFANVKGEARRKAICQALEEDRVDEVPAELRADALSPELRDQVGRTHPSYMGGEYLPGYLPGEVEIARVALESTTGDVYSIRARRVGGRIRYRVVDEYEGAYRTSPQSSSRPLTLRQLIRLIDTVPNDSTDAVGLVASARDPEVAGPDLEGMADFAQVSSTFYPELERWYGEDAAEWLEAMREAEGEGGNDG